MNQVYQNTMDSFSNLTLAQILEKEALGLDEIFSIRDIHSKIKRQMKFFIDYCKINESFTYRMITLGLHTPITENSDPVLKNLVYVSSDVLTSDHQAVAHLLIMSNDRQRYDSQEEDEIEQEIETEENTHQPIESDKYKFLNKIVSYIQGEQLDENCVNYIMTCLENLARKRLNAFLQYFGCFPGTLEKLVRSAHFLSIAHMLSKLLSDGQDNMTQLALEAKNRIIPLLLQKIHDEISSSNTEEVLHCVEEILNSSRYGDPQDRSVLQELSDDMVSEKQLNFYINTIQVDICKLSESSFNKIYNSVLYLGFVIARMIMDEQSDYVQDPKPYKPTLKYAQQVIFPVFCKLILLMEQIESFKMMNQSRFKLLYVKYAELLVSMTRHSLFGQYYSLISKQARINSIKFLISSIVGRKVSGILLQTTSLILERIILTEEKISESNPEHPNKVSPSQLYALISKYYQDLNSFVKNMMKETAQQRNRNEQGIYLRKLLIVLDNFFNNKEIQKSFPEIETVSKLFPTFSVYNCKQFTDLTAVGKHPAFTKAKTPQEFLFIQRNRNHLSQISIQEIQQSKVATQELEKQQILQSQTNQKIENPKNQQTKANVVQSIESPKLKKQMKQAKQNDIIPLRVDSPTRPQIAPQPCLIFFIRHLAIY